MEEEKEKKQEGRPGKTVISSVSLSREFQEIISLHNISPTEAIRKGIAVELCELNIDPYTNPLNKNRLANIQAWINYFTQLDYLKQELQSKRHEAAELSYWLTRAKNQIDQIIKEFDER